MIHCLSRFMSQSAGRVLIDLVKIVKESCLHLVHCRWQFVMVGSLDIMHFTASLIRGRNRVASASCVIRSPSPPNFLSSSTCWLNTFAFKGQQQHHALLTSGMHALYTDTFIYVHITSLLFFFAVSLGVASTLPSLGKKPTRCSISSLLSPKVLSNHDI